MADSDNDSGGQNANSSASSPREQDRLVPECVSEFISFITGEASDKCQREKRKTINGDDLLWAMTTLGFEDYVEPLKGYLQKFREIEGEKTALGRGQPDHAADAVNPGGGGFGGGGGGVYGGTGVAQPAAMMMMSHGHHHHHHHHNQIQGHHNMFGSGSGNSSTGRPNR
ncbi:Nuclear transcription factor Y subunit B-3 [Morus notabilis]|uniref:Nuclear transcription factor Y subunit B-3 n=1 Tax=Morus notabilis TaxID=981085 RepID=W9QE07_9ROSA|nr:nuclear transcription factor Y subunit B-2 [Morus notabilis]EXB29554.1 Nuclear transcription factor Y subunit B-3 [Morus notabilis]